MVIFFFVTKNTLKTGFGRNVLYMSCFVTIIHIYVHETDAKRVLNNRKRFNHCNMVLLQINVRFHLRIRKRMRKRRGGGEGLRSGT